MNKTVLMLFLLSVAGFALLSVWKSGADETKKSKSFTVQKSEAQWKAELNPKAFSVLRQHDTEGPNTSPLNKVTEPGTFACAGCGQALFETAHKFDSGTGWPSFYQPISAKAVGTRVDYKLIVPRTEVHCARCGGHLGHVFNDGPKPTGQRFCLNGVALKFAPK